MTKRNRQGVRFARRYDDQARSTGARDQRRLDALDKGMRAIGSLGCLAMAILLCIHAGLTDTEGQALADLIGAVVFALAALLLASISRR